MQRVWVRRRSAEQEPHHWQHTGSDVIDVSGLIQPELAAKVNTFFTQAEKEIHV